MLKYNTDWVAVDGTDKMKQHEGLVLVSPDLQCVHRGVLVDVLLSTTSLSLSFLSPSDLLHNDKHTFHLKFVSPH